MRAFRCGARRVAQATLAALLFATFVACSSHDDEQASGCASTATSGDSKVNNAVGTLHGTLTLPAGCGPHPAVLLLPGSGSIDRDGNQLAAGFHSNTYAQIGEALAEHGVASLRYDKAGVGASVAAASGVSSLRVETEVADAVSWVDSLRGDARFSSIVLAGHSEGALIALLVAESKAIDAYASLEGAGRPVDEVLREQLARNSGLSTDLLTSANAILDELLLGRVVSDVPAELRFLFAPAAQPYLISWMRYDPAQEFAKTTMPALIVHGTTDVQITLTDAELLAAARPDARKVVVEEMNHMLKPATLDNESQSRAYRDPGLVVKAEVVDALRELVDRTKQP